MLPFKESKEQALASYLIRRGGEVGKFVIVTEEIFKNFDRQSLPSPFEAADSFLLYLSDDAEGRPGRETSINYGDPALLGTIGCVDWEEVNWIVHTLSSLGLVDISQESLSGSCNACITYRGWARVEDLKTAKITSNFAFFARKFANSDLDFVFENCLRPTVKELGYELRIVTQRAGLIDAVVEDEIRRCKFLIADLSDDNAGAYWEAGLAEGLRKPVIYLCRKAVEGREINTHFDTNHRQTVRWELGALEETARSLEAVIRNTLAGDTGAAG